MDQQDAERLIIVALDAERRQSLRVAGLLADHPFAYKIHVLHDRYGRGMYRNLRRRIGDRLIFSDLKVCESPENAVARVDAAGANGANIVSVLAYGGFRMLATVQKRSPFRTVAVTVPTWLTGREVKRLHGLAADEVVRYYVRLARVAGFETVLCSPREVHALRNDSELSRMELWVTGIRPKGSARGDQRRYATPAQAIAAGAQRLIIGGPIVEASDPVAAFNAIAEEIAAAMEERR